MRETERGMEIEKKKKMKKKFLRTEKSVIFFNG